MGSVQAARLRAGFWATIALAGCGALSIALLVAASDAHAEPAADAASHAATSRKLAGYEVMPLGRGNYNRLCLPITVDGTKGLVILDTGAGGTFLSMGKFGFLLQGDHQKLPEGVPTKARLNDLSVPVALTHDFRLGSVKVGGFPLRLAGKKYFEDASMLYAQSANYSYDGYLGEEVLRHFNAIIDCSRLILYLNTDRNKQTNLQPAMTAAGWVRVPMTDAGPHLVVPCTLEGHKFNLLVDTGAPFTHLDRGLLRKYSIETKEFGMSGGLIGTRVPVRADLAMSDSIQIGNFTAQNVHMIASDSLNEAFIETQKRAPDATLLGLLGGDILGHNNAIIDIGGHSLYLKRTDPAAVKKQ